MVVMIINGVSSVFNKSRPSLEEEKRISAYFDQYDTAEFKIHDRMERQDKINQIFKMINKLKPREYEAETIGGGITSFNVIFIDKEYYTKVISVNSKESHGIELLTLNQLEYVEEAVKEWRKI